MLGATPDNFSYRVKHRTLFRVGTIAVLLVLSQFRSVTMKSAEFGIGIHGGETHQFITTV